MYDSSKHPGSVSTCSVAASIKASVALANMLKQCGLCGLIKTSTNETSTNEQTASDFEGLVYGRFPRANSYSKFMDLRASDAAISSARDLLDPVPLPMAAPETKASAVNSRACSSPVTRTIS